MTESIYVAFLMCQELFQVLFTYTKALKVHNKSQGRWTITISLLHTMTERESEQGSHRR